jgi:hypothetical protein
VRTPGGSPPVPELVLENLPLGRHGFEIRKPCFRTERVERVLTVDLLSSEPDVVGPLELRPARATLIVQGQPQGAAVSIDGDPAGTLPTRPIFVCPGPRRVSVVHDGRRVWGSVETVEDGEERAIEALPRPNAVLVSAESWPESFAAVAGSFNEPVSVAAPAAWDPSRPDAWRSLDLAPDVDLAVAGGPGAPAWAWSPVLGRVEHVLGPPWESHRPAWGRWSWGLATTDSTIGGPALVVDVEPGGAAAQAGIAPGDRIVSLGGKPVASHAEVAEALDVARYDASVEAAWRTPAGEEKSATVAASWSPALLPPPASTGEAMLRAAWAAVDAASRPDRAAAALVNLAALQAELGDPARAIDSLRRASFPERRGFGQGTVDYRLGRELLALGRTEEAIAAFRRAAASEATARDDEGPEIAPAARARLRELAPAGR